MRVVAAAARTFGDLDGAILHGDEIVEGLRANDLVFEDHGHSIEIEAGCDGPESELDLARSLVCG